MSMLGNIIWILFGGIFTALYWFAVGCLFCLTIVGIPLGRQAFKMASLTLAPFGKTIEYGGGAPSLRTSSGLSARASPWRSPT